MARLFNPTGTENFNDPSCGSGRLSLAANSVNPDMFPTLIDIDHTCARMCALNLMYHGIHGIVISDNALIAGKDFRGAFIVNRLLRYTGVPQIEYIPDKGDAYGHVRNKLGMAKPAIGSSKSLLQEVADVIIDQKTGQTSLF